MVVEDGDYDQDGQLISTPGSQKGGQDLIDQVMNAKDESQVWKALGRRGKDDKLDVNQFKGLMYKLELLSQHNLMNMEGEEEEAGENRNRGNSCSSSRSSGGAAGGGGLRSEGFEKIFCFLRNDSESLKSGKDIEFVMDTFARLPRRIPAKEGNKILEQYLSVEGGKNIRRLFLAARTALEEPEPPLFERLLSQLNEQALSKQSRRNLANALYALRKMNIERKIRPEIRMRSLEQFIAAGKEYPPSESSEDEDDDGKEQSLDLLLSQYSQVMYSLPYSASPCKEEGSELFADLLELMLTETSGHKVPPNQWTIVVDTINNLVLKPSSSAAASRNDARCARLGDLLVQVMDRVISSEDEATAKQIAIVLSASTWMQFIDPGHLQPLVRKLIRIFHSKREEAGTKELGNVLGSLSRMNGRIIESDSDVLQDLFDAFLSKGSWQKRDLAQALNGCAKFNLALDSHVLLGVLDHYQAQEEATNTWFIGGLLWSIAKISKTKQLSGERVFDGSFEIFDNLLEEFVSTMKQNEDKCDAIHISQLFFGLAAGGKEKLSHKNLKAVLLKLQSLAERGRCNSQALANTLGNLRSLSKHRVNAFDEETLEIIEDLFTRFLKRRCKMNEVAQALSAITELGIKIDRETVERVERSFAQAQQEASDFYKTKFAWSEEVLRKSIDKQIQQQHREKKFPRGSARRKGKGNGRKGTRKEEELYDVMGYM